MSEKHTDLKNKLREYHDRVKDHPYRLDRIYGEIGYYSLWRELFNTFLKCLRDETYLKKGATFIFGHDASDAFRAHNTEWLKKDKDEYDLALELYLGYIHRYLDGGEFNEFKMFGRSAMAFEPGHGKAIWTEWKLVDGYFVRQEPKEFWEQAVNHYESQQQIHLEKYGKTADWLNDSVDYCKERVASFNEACP